MKSNLKMAVSQLTYPAFTVNVLGLKLQTTRNLLVEWVRMERLSWMTTKACIEVAFSLKINRYDMTGGSSCC